MPGEVEKVAELEGQVTDMEAQIADLTKKLEKATAAAEGGEGNDGAAAEFQAQLDEATQSVEQAHGLIEKLTKERDDLLAISKLTKEEKDYCDGMSPEDKSAWLAKAPEDRQKDMKKRAESDEVVTIEGQEIRKSAVGEATFNVLKAQSDRIAKSEENLKIEKEAREKVELEKRAEAYTHVIGSVEERGKMLGAIEKMADDLKKSFMKVFEQAEKLAKAGFDRVGVGAGEDPSKNASIQKAARDFDGKVNEIKKRDNCTRTEAFSKARKEHPELFKSYQGEDGEAAAN
jgi:hypothetical protein